MQNTEQTDLATRLLNDDEHALGDLLRSYGPKIMVFMKQRYSGILCEADLEDVISIGLFRLWTTRERFDASRGSLQVWFFRIVENTARDVLRLGWQKARQMEQPSDFAVQPDTTPPINGHSKNVTTATSAPTQLTMDLRDIIEQLPDVQRHIVQADSISKDDVASSDWLAEELSMKPSTIRVYRKRAMDRIRRELKERGHDFT